MSSGIGLTRDTGTRNDPAWAELWQRAVLEITGQVQAVPLLSGDLHTRLVRMAGREASRGVEIRIGQAAFRLFLQRLAAQAGFFNPEVRYLPPARKASACLSRLAACVGDHTGWRVDLLEGQDAFQLTLETAGSPNGITPGLFIGFFREFMSWAGAGKVFPVQQEGTPEDDPCACRLSLSRIPLEQD